MSVPETTPGPWHVENHIHVKAENGWRVATVNVPSGSVGSWGINPAAQASLIALAPEMAEAMQEFCDRVDRGEVRSKRTYAKFKAILARACPTPLPSGSIER